MRILHLLASPFWSGPAENVAQLALAQRALGHEVSVAIDTTRSHTTAEELGAPRFRALGLLDDGGLGLSVKGSLAETWRDMRRLRSRSLDAVHAHFTHDHLVARWGTPKGAALVRSIHAPRSIRRGMPRADAYTVPASQYLRAFLGHRVMVLPALVDPMFRPPEDRAALRARLGIVGAPVVGMVSTFKPERRHLLGLEAFAQLRTRHPDARLVLVGDGAEGERIRVRVTEVGLDEAVTFAGYRSGLEYVAWLQSLDVVWILGLGNDWSARAAAQARACEVRVVGVDEGALVDQVDALVDPDPQRIVEATESDERRPSFTNDAGRIAQRVVELYAAVR